MLFFLSLLCFIGSKEQKGFINIDNQIPVFNINLDESPKERWKELLLAKREEILALKHYSDYLISSFPLVGGKILKLIQDFQPPFERLPSDYGEEIYWGSKYIGLTPGYLFFLNSLMELSTFCTSLVAEDSNGEQFFARSLDFGIFGYNFHKHVFPMTDLIRNITVITHFTRNGKYLYTTVTPAGFFGVVTGFKPGKFALSINQRVEPFRQLPGLWDFYRWLKLKSDQRQFSVFLLREVLDTCDSFDQVVEILKNTQVIAPCYFIIGSANSSHGAVVTKKRSKSDVWMMNDTTNIGRPWFILQTNYDHDLSPLFADDRRYKAYKYMLNMTQNNVGVNNLMDLMSRKPLRNKLTIYSFIMNIRNGEIQGKFQYCKEVDCPLF